MKKLIYFLPLLLLMACGGASNEEDTKDTDSTATEEPKTKEAEEPQKETNAAKFMIGKGQFNGVKINTNIADIMKDQPGLLEKGMKETGEGSFEIYKMMVDGEHVASIYPIEEKVGTIEVLTTDAATEDGIKIGSSFADLQEIYPGIEVNGSEIEGYTSAEHDGVSFQLDARIFTYELEEPLPPSTQILSISVR